MRCDGSCALSAAASSAVMFCLHHAMHVVDYSSSTSSVDTVPMQPGNSNHSSLWKRISTHMGTDQDLASVLSIMMEPNTPQITDSCPSLKLTEEVLVVYENVARWFSSEKPYLGMPHIAKIPWQSAT